MTKENLSKTTKTKLSSFKIMRFFTTGLKILIITLLFAPFVSKAETPVFVSTNEATKISDTSAIIRGTVDFAIWSETSAHFRYSEENFSDTLCNNAYYLNSSTKKTAKIDLIIPVGERQFERKIAGLSENKTYYYCAVVSVRTGAGHIPPIAYKGSVIKQFKTLPTVTVGERTRGDAFDPGVKKPVSELWVQTNNVKPTEFDQTTAIIRGTGGDSFTKPTLAATAYFRYSSVPGRTPIFCNDIYGANMVSTSDIILGGTSNKTCSIGGTYPNCVPPAEQSFYQKISNLTPDTTYYYCAILSNKENIFYGGTGIVREFHTSPLRTTVTTKNATKITATSATLNGTYSSVKNLTTYFKYKQNTETNINNLLSFSSVKNFFVNILIKTALAQTTPWKIVGEVSRPKGNYSNIYGAFNYTLSGLKPSTKYTFMAVAKDTDETIDGSSIIFTTSSASNNIGTGDDNGAGDPGGTYCIYPQVLNYTTNKCVDQTFCGPGQILDLSTNTCLDLTLKCVAPKVYNLQTNSCIEPLVCTAPQILNPIINKCETPLVCTAPKVLKMITNTCEDPISPGYCAAHPSDTLCLPGPGWVWNGDGWDGNWSGGNWNNGTWSGGTWSGNGGTWSDGVWKDGKWTSGTWTTDLKIGQTNKPPTDAIVRYHEGIETVFARQITGNKTFAKTYGYEEGSNLQTFAWNLAHSFAIEFGYVNSAGKEIRVSQPDVAAYQLQLLGNKLTVYEYYNDKIVDIRKVTTIFKNASGYEYYFKK